jgi:sigma-B regulation protein RsbU (phosphoserine phosphatase)
MIRLKSLQQRVSLFMLLPVAILLIAMGFIGFIYVRNHLLNQWGEATILKLQRAAHHIDMRLNGPMEMLSIFNKSAGMPNANHIQNMVIDQLEELEGVVRVKLTWMLQEDNSEVVSDPKHSGPNSKASDMSEKHQIMHEKHHILRFHRGSIVEVTPPRYDSPIDKQTISLISDLKDKNDKTIGRLEVVLRFDYLVDIVGSTGWWQKHKAFLINSEGKIFSSTTSNERRQFADEDPLEQSTMYAMLTMPFGTIFGKGFPPDKVSGFYKLQEAPWTLVIITDGKEVLSPIVHFRLIYFITGLIFILIILVLIRLVTGHTVASIKDVSNAADKVAKGQYDVSLPVRTSDEIGELIHSFNTMVVQLEERVRLKDSINLAREVQMNLLPQKKIDFETLDIAGKSIYCDETGGDYFDFFQIGKEQIAIVRAMIRSRAIQSGSLGEMITDVNRLLCEDTTETGNFMTLFFMVFDTAKGKIYWVRAGHDPAILYDSLKDEFNELSDGGIALGVDDKWLFQEYSRTGWGYGQVMLIGTDGIWETENPQGERFGRERLRRIICQNSYASAEKILQAIIDALTTFRQNARQEDDVTLVVVKAKPER